MSVLSRTSEVLVGAMSVARLLSVFSGTSVSDDDGVTNFPVASFSGHLGGRLPGGTKGISLENSLSTTFGGSTVFCGFSGAPPSNLRFKFRLSWLLRSGPLTAPSAIS